MEDQQVPQSTQTPGLPPGCIYEGTQIVRQIPLVAADGTQRMQRRYVAATLEEAKKKGWDFWHPEFGWIRYGWKLERDRTTDSILADSSLSIAKQPA